MAEQRKNVYSTSKSKTARGKKPSKSQRNAQLREEFKSVAGVSSRRDYYRFAGGMLILVIAFFMIISMASNLFTGSEDQADVLAGTVSHASNYGGKLGAYCAYYFMNNLFGVFSLLIPVFLLGVVLKLMLKEASPIRLWLLFIHLGVIMVVGSVDAHCIQVLFLSTFQHELSFDLGGAHGRLVYEWMTNYVGEVITAVILLLITLSYIGYWFTQVFIWFFKAFHKLSRVLFGVREEEEEEAEDAAEEEEVADEENDPADDEATSPADPEEGEEEDAAPSLVFNITDTTAEEQEAEDVATAAEEGEEDEEDALEMTLNTTAEEAKADAQTLGDAADLPPYDPKRDLSHYKYPPLTLLAKHSAGNTPIDMAEQQANKERIVTTLGNFGVEITEISATIGPTVTLYEIVPAPGQRISKIKNLEDDIALSLAALGIRIIAPIPGKNSIGIEVPNKKPQIVSMESILNTQKFQETDYELPVALGKTITNEVFMVDLAKMPHLLVAGATGQGKSVGLNAIITSLLYKKHPAELKLVMIDPKKVEFSMYQPLLKHFLAQVPDSEEPVITDVTKVVQTLKSLCQEMDNRYDLLKIAHCRNLKEYNAKFIKRRLSPEQGHRFLPYIVVVIDEYGDLMMTAGKDIELPIARIAQLARAVGIHMIIATQSPRAEIITGKIKANFPARMAFKVMGSRESGIILDAKGANNLIGRGDMLMLTNGKLTRVQCAFVDTPEVEAITDFVAAQQGYPYPFELPLVAEEGTESAGDIGLGEGSTFDQVARFVVNTQQGSTSKIQRTFKVGFNRAGRLMDQLEEAGIVGPVNGSKPREVYVQSEIELEQILGNLKAQGKHFD